MAEKWEPLKDLLTRELANGQSLFAVLDSAREIDIAFRLQEVKDAVHVSLFKGRKEEPIWDAAPYLVRCETDSHFFRWILENGWGNSWGILLTSGASLDDLCQHFQQLLLIKTEDGKELYFRFYDPRVLRVFSPTCTPEELKQFFGPVGCFLMEGYQPDTLLKQTISSKGLQEKLIPLSVSENNNSKNSTV